MPNQDTLALVRRLMAGDRWAAAAGARLVELKEGYARVRMRLREEHLNGVAVAQGGAVFTLADFAFAAASNSHGTVAVALDTSITFARAATKGVLTAEAREESLSRRTSVCNVRVTDGEGKVVALFRGTAFRKDDSIASLLAARRPNRRRPNRG
jgi:acyl-CoA thioesterase